MHVTSFDNFVIDEPKYVTLNRPRGFQVTCILWFVEVEILKFLIEVNL